MYVDGEETNIGVVVVVVVVVLGGMLPRASSGSTSSQITDHNATPPPFATATIVAYGPMLLRVTILQKVSNADELVVTHTYRSLRADAVRSPSEGDSCCCS